MARYQVIVVGAGPAGALTARHAAAGARVLLLDRRAEIGEPIRCGGLIRTASLSQFAPVKGPWVVTTFDRYRLVSPGGVSVCYEQPRVGTLLDRRIFDAELVRTAEAAGARVMTQANAEGVIRDGERIVGVEVSIAGERRQLFCDLVVAADGVASRIARSAGLDTKLTITTLGASVAGVAEMGNTAVGGCEIHLGREIAPGGYAWVFPRPLGIANVGVGVIPRQAWNRTALDCFNAFVANRFPAGRVIRRSAGGIPLALPIKRFWRAGLVIVGDAARQVNPLTGAGIFTALCAGRWAGKAIASIYGDGVPEASALAGYEKKWRQRFEAFAALSLRARRQLDRVSDGNITRAVASLGANPRHRSVAHSLMALSEAATRHSRADATQMGTPLPGSTDP